MRAWYTIKYAHKAQERQVMIMEQTHYNYEIQAWIVDGKVDKCGHRQVEPGCVACNYHGLPEKELAITLRTAKA